MGPPSDPPKVLRIELAGPVGLARIEFAIFVEPVVGISQTGAVVFVCCSVEFVGTGLGHQGDLRSGAAPGIRIRTGGGDAELLGGIERRPQNAGEGIAVLLVVVIQTIEGYVGLVGACAGDGAAAAILVLLVRRLLAKIQNSRLQAQQVGHVAPFHRQRLDGGVVDGVADRSIR